MKTIKAKLLQSYLITIFIILSLITLFSILFLYQNQLSKNDDYINTTANKIEKYLQKNQTENFSLIEQYIDLQNLFFIVLEDEHFNSKEIEYSNQSRHRTHTILRQIRFSKKFQKRFFMEDGLFKTKDYVYIPSRVVIDDDIYRFFIGMDKRDLDDFFETMSILIVFLNICIFLILALLGNKLIQKTILPLKTILQSVEKLKKEENLDKRLPVQKSNDEFELLTHTLNTMLDNIENSIKSIKQFSSDASHEMRTPLTVIQGYIETLHKDSSKDDYKKVIEKINIEQKKLQYIIDNFLILARLEKEVFQYKTSFLDEVCLEVIESNLEAIELKSLELQLDIQDNLLVSIKKSYLVIIINNLLTNAHKYTNQGYISIKAYKEDESIICEICDSGIGFNKEVQTKLFERFYREDTSRSDTTDGIGLGLSIVKKIATLYKIQIKVHSKKNHGSCFKLILPCIGE